MSKQTPPLLVLFLLLFLSCWMFSLSCLALTTSYYSIRNNNDTRGGHPPSCLFRRFSHDSTKGRRHYHYYSCYRTRDDKVQHDHDKTLLDSSSSSSTRRSFLSSSIIMTGISTTSAMIFTPQPTQASELGTMIQKAVTTSDLGISIRKSVVKGAQIMDQMDGQWEKFSDNYGLGEARFRQGGSRPKPREVPELKPLNVDLAKKLLQISDDVFVELSGIPRNELSLQIAKVDHTVRKSFERTGIDFSGDNLTMAGSVFNYDCYIHFKAYCDVIVGNRMVWNRKAFENMLGAKILPLLAPTTLPTVLKEQPNMESSKSILLHSLTTGLKLTDEILNSLVMNGLVARAERNELESEKLVDWTEGMTDIQLSIPLDGDVTLNSQILLQEQGYKVYPDFARFAIASALQQALRNTHQNVQSEEYYMDTDYNSDPNRFEVKEVLLNIVIDSNDE